MGRDNFYGNVETVNNTVNSVMNSGCTCVMALIAPATYSPQLPVCCFLMRAIGVKPDLLASRRIGGLMKGPWERRREVRNRKVGVNMDVTYNTSLLSLNCYYLIPQLALEDWGGGLMDGWFMGV